MGKAKTRTGLSVAVNIIDKIYDRVRDLVSTRKAVLMIAAAELKQRETLEGDRLRELLAGGPSGG